MRPEARMGASAASAYDLAKTPLNRDGMRNITHR